MPTRLTTTDLRFIRDNSNLSDREIADRLGFCRTWITILRKKHGIVKTAPDCRNKRGMDESTKEFIISNHPQLSIRKIAKLTGYHRKAIYNFINK